MARKSRKHLYDIDEIIYTPKISQTSYHAGGYVRLSRDDSKKRGDSLETQRNIIENYIAASPDIELTEIYSDNHKTGTNFERPGFQRMLADVESGKINCIIVKDLTRFGRNAIDSGYYLEKYLPMFGTRFVAVTDSYDSLEDVSGILLPLKNIISEAYALDIGRKRRAVHRQHIVDGRYVGRVAPYGYKKSPDDCHLLLPDEEISPIIQQIYAWANEGISKYEIARRLSAAGVPSPSHRNYIMGYLNSKNPGGAIFWKPSTVKAILTERVYVGDMVQGKYRTVNNKEIAIDPAEWVCVPNTHEAIIDPILFNRVQKLLKEKSDETKTFKSKPKSTENIFVGKVICGKCGYLMRRKSNKDGVTFWYRCESQQKYGKDICTIVSVRESDLKTEVLTTLNKLAEVLLGKFISIEHEAESSNNIDTELIEINKSLDKNGRFQRSLYENMVSGVIDRNEYMQLKSDYECKIKALSIRADEIRNRKYELKSLVSEYQDLTEAVSAAVKNNKLTSEIINKLINKIIVSPDKSFEVSFMFKDEFSEVA